MAVTPDRKRRIEQYIEALRRRLVTRVANVDMELATTFELLSPEDASRLTFAACPPGTRWGRQWEYGWFRGSISLPESVKGKRVEFLIGQGESLVYVNGRLAGGVNHGHATVLLSESAVPGETFEFLVETYAGHGPTPTASLPGQPGESVLQPAKEPYQVFSEACVVVFDEEGYQLYMDMMTLYDAIAQMDNNSLRRHRIENALLEATYALEFEADESAYSESVRKARALLRPVLAAKNGSTSPDFLCVGHAHIDVAWLWPIAQTIRKAAGTFSTAVEMMRHYPEYRFLQSQPQLYAYVKEHYPEVYEGIKRAVAAGQWIVDGALWVECDTNLVGGESLIRQFLYGKRFMREEFGVDSRVMWLPDVFGYSGALPQIMKGCGVDYFSTHKIYWNYNGGTLFPYDTYMWEGIDGTAVLAHNHRDYNSETRPSVIIDRWNLVTWKDKTDVLLYPFGWGDGGGGPTRDHLEYLRRLGDFEGVPRTRQTPLVEFFHEVERRGLPDARYVGELYFEAHRGVYTSQARTKRGNRKSEFALRDAELFATLATLSAGAEYPADALERSWKQVLLNQFHDIIPGSSIGRVYEEANALYDQVIADVSSLSAASRRSLMRPSDRAYTVWNSLSWERDICVKLPAVGGVIVDADGNLLEQQEITCGDGLALLVKVPDVPACGARTVYVADPGANVVGQALQAQRAQYTESASLHEGASAAFDADSGQFVLENEYLRLRIDQRGEITSLYDKEAARELTADGQSLNRLEMYQDQPAYYEAWDIDISYREKRIPLDGSSKVSIVAAGPLEARLKVERAISRSAMVQYVVLRSGARRVDFETEVDWQETHKLLKVAFPVDVHSTDARYEIQFGHIRRARNQNTEFERARFEVSGHKWMDVSEAGYGFSVLNDCKYGWDILDGVMRLTLLRAPVAPDPTADRGHHVFTYSVFPHNSAFGVDVVRQGYDLNVPVVVDPGELCCGSGQPLVTVSAPNVVIETIKRSEDGKAVVVRAYESVGQRSECEISFGFDVVEGALCDMLEERRSCIAVDNNKAKLTFRPFEVKTILLTPLRAKA